MKIIDDIKAIIKNDLRSMGSTLLQKMDFFNLYGLPEYKPSHDNSEDNYLGFIPIVIRNASFYGAEIGEKTSIDSDGEDNKRINIKLPWLPSEIADSVSVSYSRRGNTGIQWPEAMSKTAAMLSENLANIVLAEYNSQNLSKTLDLEFILPINRTLLTAGGTHYMPNRLEVDLASEEYPSTVPYREENIEVKDFMRNARAYLGALQGLVYPRSFGFRYPPLLAVKLGGLYRGFKGFLREVSIRTSEEMLDLGDEMFPMIIRGSLRFINVFMYSWSDTPYKILQAFVLSNNPQILFGMDYGDEDLVTSLHGGENPPSSTPSTIDNPNPATADTSGQSLTAIRRAYGRYDDFEFSEVEYGNLNGVYQSMSRFNASQDFNTLEFDPNAVQQISASYSRVVSSMNDDQLNFLGIDSRNESLLLSARIEDKIGSVQDVSSYASLLRNVRDRDLFGSLATLSRVISSSNSTLSGPIRAVVDLYWPAVSVLSTVDSGVNLNNVTDLYSNVLRLVDILENSTSLTKSDLGEAAYANSLYVEKSSNLLNEINKSLNSGITQHGDLAPVTTLHFSNLLLLETEVLKNMGSLKRVNQLLYERAYDLKSKGKLTEADVAKYKRVYDQAQKIDTTTPSGINELLYVGLSEFNEVLEE